MEESKVNYVQILVMCKASIFSDSVIEFQIAIRGR